MASIRKKDGKWRAEVRLKDFYKSGSFNSKQEAQAWALEQEQSYGRHGNSVNGKTLGDAFRKYADEISPKKKGARWEVLRLKKLLKDEISTEQLSTISADDFNKWVKRQKVSDGTILRELGLIAAVLAACRKDWKWMQHNPITDVRKPKSPAPRDRRISAEEIKRILQALAYEDDQPVTTQRQQIAVAFLLALETAMRHGELWGLQWQNINLKARFLTLPDTKNGTRRDVPLSIRAIELLEKLNPAESGAVLTIKQATAEVMFRRALQLAEIKGLTFHDTRHEALTRLARKLDVLDLARMVGHRDPRSLMIYYNATASEIAARLG